MSNVIYKDGLKMDAMTHNNDSTVSSTICNIDEGEQ